MPLPRSCGRSRLGSREHGLRYETDRPALGRDPIGRASIRTSAIHNMDAREGGDRRQSHHPEDGWVRQRSGQPPGMSTSAGRARQRGHQTKACREMIQTNNKQPDLHRYVGRRRLGRASGQRHAGKGEGLAPPRGLVEVAFKLEGGAPNSGWFAWQYRRSR